MRHPVARRVRPTGDEVGGVRTAVMIDRMDRRPIAAVPAPTSRVRRQHARRRLRMMRHRGWAPYLASTVLAIGATILASCGSSSPTVHAVGQPDQTLAAWASFPVDRVPRPLVLVGPSVADPRTGFRDGPSKLAYLERAIDLPTSLPDGPTTADSYPIISATQAARQLVSTRGKGSPAGQRLSVTEVTLGTATYQTDRGAVNLPAWQFWFNGVADPAAVAAVAPSRLFASPTAYARAPKATSAHLSPDGDTITIEFVGAAAGTGPCTADYTVDVASSRTAVAVGVHEHAYDSGAVACAGVGYRRQVTARLDAPLGARVLVDDASGLALPVTPSA